MDIPVRPCPFTFWKIVFPSFHPHVFLPEGYAIHSSNQKSKNRSLKSSFSFRHNKMTLYLHHHFYELPCLHYNRPWRLTHFFSTMLLYLPAPRREQTWEKQTLCLGQDDRVLPADDSESQCIRSSMSLGGTCSGVLIGCTLRHFMTSILLSRGIFSGQLVTSVPEQTNKQTNKLTD